MKERHLNAWLSIGAYARAYGLSRPTVRKLLEQQLLEAYRVPGRTIIRIRNAEPDAHRPNEPRGMPHQPYVGVYFIRSGQFLKIGLSSSVLKRFAELARVVPSPLEALGWIPCAAWEEAHRREQALHAQFQDARANGEWFHVSPALLEDVRAIAQPWPTRTP